MRTLVAGSERLTRGFHLLLGTNAVLIAGAAVWISMTLETVAFATLIGAFGVYNLLGVLFPVAVVFPTAGPEADRTVYRLVHGMGVVFFGAVAAAAHWTLGLTPLALLSLLVGVYDLIGLAIPGLYPAMAIVYFAN